jgi:uncharacterized protein YcfJ
MKKILLSCFVGAALLSAQAQLFSPDAFGGAALGAMIGGIAGGDCHHGFSGESAAIGAGVGLIAGAIAGESRRYGYYDSPSYVCSTAPSLSFGYGYGPGGNSAHVYYSPNSYCAPAYYYRPQRPNYAVNGTLLGATSGALIGAGTCDAGKGAAIGAAAGLAIGGIAEHAARRHEQNPMTAQATVQNQVQQLAPGGSIQDAGPQPQDARSEITSATCPASTYHWTTPPAQIPDVPRVPDAPRL